MKTGNRTFRNTKTRWRDVIQKDMEYNMICRIKKRKSTPLNSLENRNLVYRPISVVPLMQSPVSIMWRPACARVPTRHAN